MGSMELRMILLPLLEQFMGKDFNVSVKLKVVNPKEIVLHGSLDEKLSMPLKFYSRDNHKGQYFLEFDLIRQNGLPRIISPSNRAKVHLTRGYNIVENVVDELYWKEVPLHYIESLSKQTSIPSSFDVKVEVNHDYLGHICKVISQRLRLDPLVDIEYKGLCMQDCYELRYSSTNIRDLSIAISEPRPRRVT